MKTQAVRIINVVVLLAVTLVTSVGYCAIPRTSRTLSFYLSARDFSRGFDLALIKPIESTRTIRMEDVSKVIPFHEMRSSNDGGYVASQILDHSLSNFFNSPTVRNSDLGRTAHQVEKSMEGDVAFGGTEPESIKHAFKFAMRATQTRAQVEYTGLTNAQLTYNVFQARLNLEVREPMKALNTQVVYNHITQPGDQIDMVSLRWAW
jgi:hypothetical protein